MLLVGAVEAGVVAKARGRARLRRGDAVEQELLRVRDALADDVVDHRGAGHLAERLVELGFGDVEARGERVERDGLGEMLVDVAQQAAAHEAARAGLRIGRELILARQRHEDAGDERLQEDRDQRALQGLRLAVEIVELAQHVENPGVLHVVEAAGVRLVRQLAQQERAVLVGEDRRVEVHGVAVVWLLRMHMDAVEHVRRDAQQRVRAQGVFRAADGKGGVPGENIEQLVGGVGMDQAASGGNPGDVVRDVVQVGLKADVHECSLLLRLPFPLWPRLQLQYTTKESFPVHISRQDCDFRNGFAQIRNGENSSGNL